MHVREVLTETLHRVHGTYMVRKWLSTDDRIRSSRSVLAAYWSERPSAAYVLNSSKLTWHAWRSWKSLEYLSSYQYVLKSMKSTYSVRRVAAAFLPNFLVVLHTSARTRWYVRAFIRIRFSTIWHPFPYLNPISLFGTILATMLTSLLCDILMLLTILFHPFLVVMIAGKDTKSVSFLKLAPFIHTGSTNDFLLFDPFIILLLSSKSGQKQWLLTFSLHCLCSPPPAYSLRATASLIDQL